MIKQVFAGLGVLWLAATLVFFALRLLPGDAISAQITEGGLSAAQIAERRAALGLDQPVLMQYGRWLAGLLSGDLGVSLLDSRPVTEIVGQQLAPTLALAVSALLTAIILGSGLGIAAGLGMESARLVLTLALSAPIYWTGTLAIWLFAVVLDWLPTSGGTGTGSLVLPSLVLGLHTAGSIGRVIAANVNATLDADFILTARMKGLTERSIMGRHVLRVSLLPAVNVVALQAGFLLSGVVITETLFLRPGVGRVLLDAVLRQDYPVVQGISLWIALVYLAVNTAADVIVRQLDPRVAA
ncbi:MAG: ABC transporter permease [Anaerolineae bacterium]|nr:ABC transporter permease [Anaerolineae bacterium]